jgi:predicted O-methyltransferase YrrM
VKTFKLEKCGRTWIRNEARSYPEDWATEVEVFDFLYGFVRMVKPEKVLEIGTFEGDTALAMAKGLKENNFGHLVTLDIQDFGQEKVIADVELTSYVTCIKNDPLIYLANTQDRFDMAFIDDGHHYDEAIRDLENCHRLVKTHGYILGHDVLMVNSINLAYTNFLDKHKDQYHKIIIDCYDGLFILKKLYD